jgi:hypothetical protein
MTRSPTLACAVRASSTVVNATSMPPPAFVVPGQARLRPRSDADPERIRTVAGRRRVRASGVGVGGVGRWLQKTPGNMQWLLRQSSVDGRAARVVPVGVAIAVAVGVGAGRAWGRAGRRGWAGFAVIGLAQPADPGEVPGSGLGEAPAAVVAQSMIVAAAGAEVGVGGWSAGGVFEAVVGVARQSGMRPAAIKLSRLRAASVQPALRPSAPIPAFLNPCQPAHGMRARSPGSKGLRQTRAVSRSLPDPLVGAVSKEPDGTRATSASFDRWCEILGDSKRVCSASSAEYQRAVLDKRRVAPNDGQCGRIRSRPFAHRPVMDRNADGKGDRRSRPTAAKISGRP